MRLILLLSSCGADDEESSGEVAAPGAPKRGRNAGVDPIAVAVAAAAPAAAVGDDVSSLQLFVLATAAATAAATARLRGEPLSARLESAINVDFAPREFGKKKKTKTKERDDDESTLAERQEMSHFFSFVSSSPSLFLCLVGVCKSTRDRRKALVERKDGKRKKDRPTETRVERDGGENAAESPPSTRDENGKGRKTIKREDWSSKKFFFWEKGAETAPLFRPFLGSRFPAYGG